MRARQIVTIAVVALLMIGGVAALGAALPADQANDNATDAYENNGDDSDELPNDSDERPDDVPADAGDSSNASDERPDHVPADPGESANASDNRPDHVPADNGNASNASDNRSDNATSVGPSDGLPEQVPDHVSEIHDHIESFLNGSIENLGHALSELLSSLTGDAPAEE